MTETFQSAIFTVSETENDFLYQEKLGEYVSGLYVDNTRSFRVCKLSYRLWNVWIHIDRAPHIFAKQLFEWKCIY